MNQQRLGAALAVLFLLGLGGCTAFGGGKSTDTSSRTRAALEIPPDLARPAGDDSAVVAPGGAANYSDYAAKPQTGAATAATASVAATAAAAPSVPATTTAPAERVHLERDGAYRWLVVQGAVPEVWTEVRDYLMRNNYKLTVDNPKTGQLETDWIDRPVQFSNAFGRLLSAFSSTGLRDKFRVRIEAGRAPGTVEVYVSHLGMEEVVKSKDISMGNVSTTWQPRASDTELEADLIGKLMAYLGASSQEIKNQLASAATPRAQLTKAGLLLTQIDLDMAWRRVGQALDRSRVVIEDLDRSTGIYYVHYISRKTAKEGTGFLGLGSATDSETKDESARDRFQVVLKTQADGTNVTVRDVKGEPDSSASAGELLQQLYQQLK